jgi:predicted thioesterase
MRKGLTAAIEFAVTAKDTAEVLLSGDLPVLGTPRLVAWLEAATCAAVRDTLPEGQTTVGTRIAVEHRAASPVGARITAQATVTHVDGRLLKFEVVATDADNGVVLGHGEITRVVVDRERFLARVTG